MFKVAIIGASGYTGGELLRMLLNHPEVEITDITSRQYDGTPAHKIHPHIRDSGLVFSNKSPSDLDVDVAFTATPHGASMKIVPELLETGMKVVDLSGDYRYRETKSKNLTWLQILDASRQELYYHHIHLLKMDSLKELLSIQKVESAALELMHLQPHIIRILQTTSTRIKSHHTDTPLKSNRNCMDLMRFKFHLHHTSYQ